MRTSWLKKRLAALLIAVSAVTAGAFTYHESVHAAQHSNQTSAGVPVLELSDCSLCLGHHFSAIGPELRPSGFEFTSVGRLVFAGVPAPSHFSHSVADARAPPFSLL
ncbi:MAG: hypothetical protein NDJ89_16980 [Oligoflexia bacterium]|nr:hypothetical protein [Oligoflexia bacterium]